MCVYVTNVSKEVPEELTQLNYQFLATVSIQPEEFRPADLPGGWDHSPAEDQRNWLTKATEQLYCNLRADEYSRRAFFLDSLARPDISRRSREYIMASVLKKNPLFLNEPVYTRQLDAKAEQVLKDYAVGRLLVAGDIRYLSGDLLALLYYIADYNHALSWWDVPFRTQVLSDQFASNSFYAPGAVYSKEEHGTLLRNPHIARNEEIQLSVYPEDELRDTFFGHLTDVVMVDARMLAAERLGGADYDGDLVRTIAAPILNACVRRNYIYNKYDPEINLINNANLPFLMIPFLASPKQNPNDWYARFTTVKNTFSARIGQICNAALDRFFAGTDWERVDSPVERLPLLARRLQKEMKKPQTKRAADFELFTFAQEQNWKAKLNRRTLERVDALLTDYEACLKRIRSCRRAKSCGRSLTHLIVRSMLFNLKCVVFAAAVIIRSDKPLDAAVLLFGEHPIAVDYVVERSFVGAKPLNIELAVHHVLKHFSATVEILRAAFYRKIFTKHEAPVPQLLV